MVLNRKIVLTVIVVLLSSVVLLNILSKMHLVEITLGNVPILCGVLFLGVIFHLLYKMKGLPLYLSCLYFFAMFVFQPIGVLLVIWKIIPTK